MLVKEQLELPDGRYLILYSRPQPVPDDSDPKAPEPDVPAGGTIPVS